MNDDVPEITMDDLTQLLLYGCVMFQSLQDDPEYRDEVDALRVDRSDRGAADFLGLIRQANEMMMEGSVYPDAFLRVLNRFREALGDQSPPPPAHMKGLLLRVDRVEPNGRVETHHVVPKLRIDRVEPRGLRG